MLFFVQNTPFKCVLAIASLWIFGTTQALHYPISGVHTGLNASTGERPTRRNIIDLQTDLPSWSLYIQALDTIMKIPEDNMFSWFQIAGIHGRPYYAWDNVVQTPGAPDTGYCTHFNPLFPTWHRPYLALFEQLLAGHIQTLAKDYNSNEYQNAADRFRIPYWDFSTIPTVPDVVNQQTVLINLPSGLANVTNPLLLYKFQQFPLNSTWFPGPDIAGEGDISTYPTTMRYPIGNVSHPDGVNQVLQSSNLMSRTYSVFKSIKYNQMATSPTEPVAFEFVHNVVHAAVGGGIPEKPGHMGVFSYSAFDPIFFLVHVHVDRLFAMWQAMYPDEMLTVEVDDSGSFTNIVGDNLTISTPLTPFFRKDGKTPYTSTTARYTKSFGYSYSEVQDWLPFTPAQLAANVSALVEKLYNPNRSS